MKPNITPNLPEALVKDFLAQLEDWGVFLGREKIGALAFYAEELASYDKANIVGPRDPGKLWMDHVLDSLSCLLYDPLSKAESLVDVGSGGGMPGIPLHLAVGFQRACLLESTRKKAEFLRQVSSKMEIKGLEVANSRAEESGQSQEHRERFEAATVRAVAPLAVISEYCLPLLSLGGTMIAMKAKMGAKERTAGEKAAKKLGGELEEIVEVPFSSHLEPKDRCLVLVKKVRHTSHLYPREPGVPKKSPLGSAG